MSLNQKTEEPKPRTNSNQNQAITNLEDLVREIKALNPNVPIEITRDENGKIIEMVHDKKNAIVLPVGFKYDKDLGINNKVDDKTPYICLPVKQKEQVKTEEPPKNGPKKGTRHKVKKIRRAVVAPYVNSTICFTALAAYSFMVFNLLCAPCFAAMGAIKREMNNTKWFWIAIGYQCGFAYVCSLIVYQLGSLINGGSFSFGTIVGFILLIDTAEVEFAVK